MPVTSFASGGSPVNPATIGVEHTLASVNQAGVYQGWVDFANHAAGDVTELRVYKMAKSGGTSRVVEYASFAGAQPTDDMVKHTLGFSNAYTDTDALKFTLLQTKGTGRSFDYGVDKIA